jgi:glycosyltransferase involved in cell wall biosynthesis
LLKWLGKVNTLIENREDEGFSWRRRDYFLLRMTRWLPDRVICVSEAVRRVVSQKERLAESRAIVVHNGVPPLDVTDVAGDELRRELGLADDHLVVGMVANLNRAVKGASYLLDAAPVIIREVPETRFLLLGRGKGERALLARARALGVERNVILAGYRDEIHSYYATMDISVLTSLSEGLSLTLLESMAHGLPVVVTRVGGNAEVVVDGETGFLVPPRDVASFSEKVIALLRSPELRARLGRAGRHRVNEHFQIERAAARYLQIYETALAGLRSNEPWPGN